MSTALKERKDTLTKDKQEAKEARDTADREWKEASNLLRREWANYATGAIIREEAYVNTLYKEYKEKSDRYNKKDDALDELQKEMVSLERKEMALLEQKQGKHTQRGIS